MSLEKLFPQAVFLDRDGTIGGNGNLVTPEEFVLFPYAQAAINSLKENGIYICPHIDEDNCNCRKPKIGMLEHASRKYHLDLSRCYVVGDSWKDMLAADRAGSKKILVKSGGGLNAMRKLQEEFPHITLDCICENLEEAVDYILNM